MYVGADYTLYVRTSEKQTGKLLSIITQQMAPQPASGVHVKTVY